MFLKEIYLKNYKCFEEKTFSFDKRFTVLVGDNGSGKTALLDGIARGLKALTDCFNHKPFDMYLEESEVRVVSKKISSKSNLEKQMPYEIMATINDEEGDNVKWNFTYGGANPNQLEDYIEGLNYYLKKGGLVTLPITAFYRISRHWSTEKFDNIDLYPIGSRLDTYKDCLNPKTSSKTILEWFKRMAIIEFQKGKFPPELKAVQEAIKKALESLRKDDMGEVNAHFSAENDELLIDIGDGKEFPFRLLSDGYRNTLGMIADIAYRMAELNPHVTTDTPGVVLIDELDLHLHPKWQRSVVGDLKRIFPNCQFIVTTHSPFIIQSLSSEDAVIILDNEYEEVPEDFINKSIEDIVEEIQGVENPQWSRKRMDMYDAAKKYFQLLEKMDTKKDANEIKQMREELELITKPYATNVAYTAFLEQKKLVKEASLGNRPDILNEPGVEYKTKKKGKN